MPRVRVHQHVNPLSPYYRFTPKPLEIEKVFENPDLPLHLDIGCARGRFILKMAEIKKNLEFSRSWKFANRWSKKRIASQKKLN